MKPPSKELEQQAFAAMAAIQALAKADHVFTIAFMMQGVMALSVDAGMTRKDVMQAFAAAMAAFERSLKELAADSPEATAH